MIKKDLQQRRNEARALALQRLPIELRLEIADRIPKLKINTADIDPTILSGPTTTSFWQEYFQIRQISTSFYLHMHHAYYYSEHTYGMTLGKPTRRQYLNYYRLFIKDEEGDDD